MLTPSHLLLQMFGACLEQDHGEPASICCSAKPAVSHLHPLSVLQATCQACHPLGFSCCFCVLPCWYGVCPSCCWAPLSKY